VGERGRGSGSGRGVGEGGGGGGRKRGGGGVSRVCGGESVHLCARSGVATGPSCLGNRGGGLRGSGGKSNQDAWEGEGGVKPTFQQKCWGKKRGLH